MDYVPKSGGEMGALTRPTRAVARWGDRYIFGMRKNLRVGGGQENDGDSRKDKQ